MKTQPWAIFTRVRTAKRSAGLNHNDSLEDDYCGTFFKLKFLIPTLRHMIYSPNSSNIHREWYFATFVSGNKLVKCTSLWLFKKDSWEEIILLMGRKYRWVLPKYMINFWLVDILSFDTFLCEIYQKGIKILLTCFYNQLIRTVIITEQ